MIIPTDPLSTDDVAERSTRHRLTLARTDGLAFAHAHGLDEHDRYVLDGDAVAIINLHLPHNEPGEAWRPTGPGATGQVGLAHPAYQRQGS